MKKPILLFFLLFSSLVLADSVLLVKKGWQLLGSSVALTNMSAFPKGKVEQVLYFDASSQEWLGYSPDKNTQDKMTNKGLNTLTTLQNWHGFWVKSSNDWALLLPTPTLASAPSKTLKQDNIELKKGWNLISLPIDTVLSPKVFGELTVWKYNAQQKWELSLNTKSSENTDFPPIGHIKNSDGLWVKADKDQNISLSEESSKLHHFDNTQEMEAYITQMATQYQRPFCGIEPFFLESPRTALVEDMVFAPVAMAESSNALAPTSSKSAEESTNTSSTNLQENNVDEADILKHNATHIFYKVSKDKKQSIAITSFQALSENNHTALNHIYFDDKRNIDNMYLQNEKLVVLSNSYEKNPKILVDIFDVSHILSIQKLSSYAIDGYAKTSRMIGNSLYLVSQFNPQIQITYPKILALASKNCQNYFQGLVLEVSLNAYADCYGLIQDEEGKGYYYKDYENPQITITQLTPNIEGSKLEKQNLLLAKRFYAPLKQKQNTSITTLSHFDISKGEYTKSTSIIGNSNIEYASSKALYLVSTEYPFYYDFNNYKERSTIYKLKLDDNLTYTAVGSVYGHALNQFALSEYNDTLRIATTEGFSWGSDGTKNSLYTLKAKEGLLTIQGLLSGLGKSNETIKAVRFMGTKAYVVTFRQTDPFYTIDLSEALAPKKVGELQVSGYSDYLHPIGEDKILGIGREADSLGRTKGIKIELFDVSDFANPRSLDSIVLADDSSTSLSYDHKAFAYRSSDSLFAFPYQIYGDYMNNYENTLYLGIYQVKNNALIDYEDSMSNSLNWGEKRGLLFDMNGKTYISFFANDTINTTTLKEK